MNFGVHFYLDRNTAPITPIMLSVTSNYKRFRLSTGKSIEPTGWDSVREKAKKSYRYALEINKRLESIQVLITDYVSRNRNPNLKELRDLILVELNPHAKIKKVPEKSLLQHYFEFIKTREETGKYRPKTLQRLLTSANHLSEFVADTGYKLSFKTLDNTFVEKLFLFSSTRKKLSNNSIDTILRNLKTFLTHAD